MHKYIFLAASLLLTLQAQAQIPYIDSKEVLTKGVEFYQNGDYKKSIEQYRQVHECDTNYASAVYEQVLSSIADSAYETAKELAYAGLNLPDCDKRGFLLNLGAIYDYLGKTDSSMMIYDSVIRMCPNDHQPWYEEGVIFFKKKEYDKALPYFQHSLRINPNHFASHYLLGMTYMFQGRLSEGFIALESSLLMTDNAATAKKSISLINSITVETDEVVKCYHEKNERYSHPLFDDIDQLVNSKLALSGDYTLKMSLNDNIFRQSQVIMEKLKYDPADTNFVMQYYVPLLADLFKNDMIEAFILFKYSGYGFENVDNLAKKKSKEIDEVKQIVFPYFGKIQATRELNYNKRQKAVERYHYYPKDNLIVVGTMTTNGKDDIIKGDAEMFRTNHTLRSRGRYNDKGEKEGWWTDYYAVGGIRSREYYANGVERDSSFNYYTNGNLSMITIRDREGVAKAEYDFSSKGWLSGTKKRVTDKIIEERSFFSNGQQELVETYDDRRVSDGRYTIYYANGKPKKEVAYVSGEMSGPVKTWYENGQLNEEAIFARGKLDGRYLEYYDNGHKKEESTYKNGKEDGESQKYDEDGHLTDKFIYRNGRLQEMDKFTPGGRLYGVLKLSDDVPYYIKYTNDDGAVMLEKEDKSGIYEYRHFYANGNPAAALKIDDQGMRHGLETFYFETGAKSEETFYKNGSLEGTSTTYFKNGKVREEENYVNNLRDGYFKTYYSNGILKSEGWYKEGKAQGPWKYYNINGKLEDERYLLNDKITGIYKDYNINGELVNKYYYDDGELTAHTCFDTLEHKTDSVFYNPTAGSYKFSHWPKSLGLNEWQYSLKYGNMNGPYVSKYVNGALQEQSYFNDGKRDSILMEYYPDGKIQYKGSYKDGGKIGKWEYYDETGALLREEHFNNTGSLEGRLNHYDCNVLYASYNYKNGNKDSAQIYYGENGRTAFVMYYDKGDFIGYSYEGKDGKLLPQIKAKNGTAKFTTYYSNGQKSGEGEVVQNFLTGPFNVYYSDGKPAAERVYNSMGIDGKLKRYGTNGKVLYEVDYKDDEEMGVERSYDKDGNLLIAAGYYYGVLNGPAVVTDPVTHTTSTRYYHYGRLTSISK